MTTFKDIAPEINTMLGNRQDVMTYAAFPQTPAPVAADRLIIWLKEAYNEICLGYRFEELESEVDDQMTLGIDTYTLPALCRTIRAITLLFPQGNANQPRPIRRRHIRNIRRYQTSSNGPPSIYAPFNPGGQPSIIVRPKPDKGYQFIWDVVLKPTFTNDVVSTVVNLPDDWVDILKWSTCLRGHTALVERDKAGEVQTLLYGGYDPQLGRKVPGMIRQRVASRDQTDIEDVEYGLQPQVRRYINTK